jgi:ribonuclease P protein component
VETGDVQAAVVVSVPKRTFRKAVERNLLKRRIREAYRRNKPEFFSRLKEMNIQLHLAIQFTGQKREEFHVIEASLLKIFDQICLKPGNNTME